MGWRAQFEHLRETKDLEQFRNYCGLIKDGEVWFSLQENHEEAYRSGLQQLRNCSIRRRTQRRPAVHGAGVHRERPAASRAFSLLLCSGERREVRLFLRKSRDGIGHSVSTKRENALVPAVNRELVNISRDRSTLGT